VCILNKEKYSVEEISKRFDVSSSKAINIRKFVLDMAEETFYLSYSDKLDTMRHNLCILVLQFQAALETECESMAWAAAQRG
jgi:hypothetical protein